MQTIKKTFIQTTNKNQIHTLLIEDDKTKDFKLLTLTENKNEDDYIKYHQLIGNNVRKSEDFESINVSNIEDITDILKKSNISLKETKKVENV